MKIVRESLNEIKRGGERSGLSSIGVGKEGMKKQIKNWFNQTFDDMGYDINDNLEVILRNQTDYLKILDIFEELPPFIKIKLKPITTSFNIAVRLKDHKLLNDLIERYKKLNIIAPQKYVPIIEDLEKLNYVNITTKVQYGDDTMSFIDMDILHLILISFHDYYAELRRGDMLSFPFYRSKSDHIKYIHNVAAPHNYKPIVDYMVKYKNGYMRKLL